MKKVLCTVLCLCLFSALLAGCTSTSEESSAIESSVESVAESSEESTTENASEENTFSEESAVTDLYDWDFNKGWPVYVGEYVTEVTDTEMPYGSEVWYSAARIFREREIDLLYHVYFIPAMIKSGTELSSGYYIWYAYTEETAEEYAACRTFLDSVGIPFTVTEVDLSDGAGIADRYCADLSWEDAVKLSDLAAEQGIAILFDVCTCDALNEKTNTSAPDLDGETTEKGSSADEE